MLQFNKILFLISTLIVIINAYENTTRLLSGTKYTGPCVAYNDIDKCWRCQPNWADNRKHYAECSQGFGHAATGGKAGPIYVVHDHTDDDMLNPKPGTLRHAVIQNGPLWIVFKHDMRIKLKQELIFTSDKTIDGRGADVHISEGAGFMLQFVKNVIISNIKFHDIKVASGGMIRDSLTHFGQRAASDGDAIQIFGSTTIWCDHLSMLKGDDGLIDVVAASNDVTISNCHFTDHSKVLLLGASDTDARDKNMHVTVAYNHFGKRLSQRMPRCRWGFIHVVNNDYTHWEMYAIGGSKSTTIICQGNRFVAPPDVNFKQVTHRIDAPEAEWKKWTWRSEGDLMVNGAFMIQSGNPDWAKGYHDYQLIKPRPATEVRQLTQFAGTLRCIINQPC